jgi:hypothetical protein
MAKRAAAITARASPPGSRAPGAKGGTVYGSTDELGATVAENQVHVHDFHATILHLLGMDHERLTFRHGGRDYRLTDVHGHVVQALLA